VVVVDAEGELFWAGSAVPPPEVSREWTGAGA
jgi:hypothetical protein